MIFFCVGVMYSGEYDACDVTLSVYPHRASMKNIPDHGGNRTYDLWNTSPMLNLVPRVLFVWPRAEENPGKGCRALRNMLYLPRGG